jgi:antitoxin (DNA-binding transcriptional repressor) of toxin-antitoxin stability system
VADGGIRRPEPGWRRRFSTATDSDSTSHLPSRAHRGDRLWPARRSEEGDDCLETRIELAEFAVNAASLLQELREAGGSLVLTVEGKAVAELLPIYREPPPELAASVLWEAEDAFEPQPELWAALR